MADKNKKETKPSKKVGALQRIKRILSGEEPFTEEDAATTKAEAEAPSPSFKERNKNEPKLPSEEEKKKHREAFLKKTQEPNTIVEALKKLQSNKPVAQTSMEKAKYGDRSKQLVAVKDKKTEEIPADDTTVAGTETEEEGSLEGKINKQAEKEVDTTSNKYEGMGPIERINAIELDKAEAKLGILEKELEAAEDKSKWIALAQMVVHSIGQIMYTRSASKMGVPISSLKLPDINWKAGLGAAYKKYERGADAIDTRRTTTTSAKVEDWRAGQRPDKAKEKGKAALVKQLQKKETALDAALNDIQMVKDESTFGSISDTEIREILKKRLLDKNIQVPELPGISKELNWNLSSKEAVTKLQQLFDQTSQQRQEAQSGTALPSTPSKPQLTREDAIKQLMKNNGWTREQAIAEANKYNEK